MCTVDDTDIAAEVVFPDEVKLADGESMFCRKCISSEGKVLLQGKDVYCKNCFLIYVTHKFRASLGKSKLMKPTDHVLVAFSGGQSSTALLHMLWMGTQEDDHKKLLYKISFLYIDEGAILGQDIERRRRRISEVKLLVEKYHFKIYLTTLSRTLQGGPCIVSEESPFDATADGALLQLFQETISLTAREDLLLKLRQNILFAAAKEIGCNKIFTAEGQSELAVKLLTSIAVGRGEQLALEVGFQDSRFADVLLLRPIRDLDQKEIVYYNHFNKLSCHQNASLTSAKPRNCSIRKLTEEFITGLHRDFPSTVSVIFRIGEKLKGSNTNCSGSQDFCVLCRGTIQDVAADSEHPYSAVAATMFSQSVSSANKQQQVSENGCCGSCKCSAQEGAFTTDELKQFFCYGCLLIIKELNSLTLLPPNIIDEIKRRRSLTSMRNQIADFLL